MLKNSKVVLFSVTLKSCQAGNFWTLLRIRCDKLDIVCCLVLIAERVEWMSPFFGGKGHREILL